MWKHIHKYCVCAYESVLESLIRFLANQIVPNVVTPSKKFCE